VRYYTTRERNQHCPYKAKDLIGHRTEKPTAPNPAPSIRVRFIIQPGWNVRDVTTTEAKEHIASIKANILARVNEDPPLPGSSSLLKYATTARQA